MIQLVAACCILHNICEVHGDSFDASWQVESDTNVSSSETSSAVALGITANGSVICEPLVFSNVLKNNACSYSVTTKLLILQLSCYICERRQ